MGYDRESRKPKLPPVWGSPSSSKVPPRRFQSPKWKLTPSKKGIGNLQSVVLAWDAVALVQVSKQPKMPKNCLRRVLKVIWGFPPKESLAPSKPCSAPGELPKRGFAPCKRLFRESHPQELESTFRTLVNQTAKSTHHPHKNNDQHLECKTGGGAYFAFFLGSDNSHTTPAPPKCHLMRKVFFVGMMRGSRSPS